MMVGRVAALVLSVVLFTSSAVENTGKSVPLTDDKYGKALEVFLQAEGIWEHGVSYIPDAVVDEDMIRLLDGNETALAEDGEYVVLYRVVVENGKSRVEVHSMRIALYGEKDRKKLRKALKLK